MNWVKKRKKGGVSDQGWAPMALYMCRLRLTGYRPGRGDRYNIRYYILSKKLLIGPAPFDARSDNPQLEDKPFASLIQDRPVIWSNWLEPIVQLALIARVFSPDCNRERKVENETLLFVRKPVKRTLEKNVDLTPRFEAEAWRCG